MKRKLHSCLFIPIVVGMGTFLVLFNSCKKEEIPLTPEPQLPVLTTNTPVNVLQTTAECGGEVTSDGGDAITARGVVWSTTPLPTIALTTKTSEGAGAGKFVSIITGLNPNTTYYVRAYATNSVGTSYGGATVFNFITRTFPAGISGPITDVSGYKYNPILIGTQIWLVENLKTTKYRDGTSIANVTDDSQWGLLTTGAYCNFKNDLKNGDTYGRLYNWHAVSDVRGICPLGWHVPTDVEWTALMDYLGGRTVAGGKLKEAGSTHWYGQNVFGTNEVGFTALPGDFRPSNGIIIYHLFFSAYFWTSTPVSVTSASAYYNWIPYYDKLVTRASTDKKVGYSVRCIKDPV